MVEKVTVNGREYAQIPIENYNELMDFIAAKKKEKEDYYVKRYEMALKAVEEGKSFGLDEWDAMFDRIRERAIKRRLGKVVNE